MTVGLRSFVACVLLVAGLALFSRADESGWVDTHNHLQGGRNLDFDGAARTCVAAMDRLGIETMLVMPPPQTLDQHGVYRAEQFLDSLRPYGDRFAFLAGGGTLNVMIQEAVEAGHTSPELRQRFRKRADEIARLGAVGYGEMTAEHLSMNPAHPYVAARPDHPLFLLLADLAAQNGLPIDLHMEAVPEGMPLPQRFSSPPNPSSLTPNTAALERLLSHNPRARIIWVHCGWDNTGHRTVELTADLLARHPNLYVSLRVAPRAGGERSSMANVPVESGGLKPEWLELIRSYPDRFLIGSDEFYLTPEMRMRRHPSTGSAQATLGILSQLPRELARKVGTENARRLFSL